MPRLSHTPSYVFTARLLLCALLIAGALTAGCSREPEAASPLVGTWQSTEMGIAYTFAADGSATYLPDGLGGRTIEGTWVGGDEGSAVVTFEGDDASWEYTLSGDVLDVKTDVGTLILERAE